MVDMIGIGEGDAGWLLPDKDKKNDLDVLMLESEIMEKKFVDPDRLKFLLSNCKEVMTVFELLHRFDRSESTKFAFDKDKRIVVLGLFNSFETSQSVSAFTGAEYAMKTYERYGIRKTDLDRTTKFMKKLLADKTVGDILFLIPPKMYSHELNGNKRYRDTASEFDYLLKQQDPKKLSKVRLVFGAYEVVDSNKFDEDVWAKNGVVDKDMSTEMERSARFEISAEFKMWLEGIPKT